jgi:hypothetical protein
VAINNSIFLAAKIKVTPDPTSSKMLKVRNRKSRTRLVVPSRNNQTIVTTMVVEIADSLSNKRIGRQMVPITTLKPNSRGISSTLLPNNNNSNHTSVTIIPKPSSLRIVTCTIIRDSNSSTHQPVSSSTPLPKRKDSNNSISHRDNNQSRLLAKELSQEPTQDLKQVFPQSNFISLQVVAPKSASDD